MTISTCDICSAVLVPNYRNQDTLKGEAALMKAGRTEFDPHEFRAFDFEITVTNFKFNMTNFHVCNKCIMDAVARAVSKKEAV